VGAGVAVAWALRPDGMPFPLNYAFIIACAWLSFNVSFAFIVFIRENPMDETERSRSTESQFGAHLREAVTTDRTFRRLMLARLLTGLDALAVPFYVVFITQRLALPGASVGGFTIAFTVGSIAGIVLFGGLADRLGALRVIHASVAMQFAAPALAFAVAAVPALAADAPSLALAAFVAIMALNGALTHSMILGFIGYTLDASPERHRAMYVGAINTVGGLVSLTPVLAGLAIDLLSRVAPSQAAYAAVFGFAALCVGAGAVLTLRLPKPVARS